MIDIKNVISRLYNKIYIPLYKKRMGKCGDNVFFSPIDSVFFMIIYMLETMYISVIMQILFLPKAK